MNLLNSSSTDALIVFNEQQVYWYFILRILYEKFIDDKSYAIFHVAYSVKGCAEDYMVDEKTLYKKRANLRCIQQYKDKDW